MNLGLSDVWSQSDASIRSRRLIRTSPSARLSTSSAIAVTAGVLDLSMLSLAAVVAGLDVSLAVLYAALGLLAVRSTELRGDRLAPRASDEIPYLIRNMALAMIGFGLLAGSRLEFGEVALVGILGLALVLLGRLVFYDVLRRLRRGGRALEPVVVVGAGPTAVNLVDAMQDHPECGLTPVGFVDHSETSSLPMPYLGSVADLSAIMERHGARHAVFAFGATREYEMISTIRRCRPQSYFYVLHRFFELGVDSGSPALNADIAGFPVRRIHPPAAGNPMLWTKRLIDVMVSTVALLLLSPVMLLCAGLVAFSSPGPILFRQTRVGWNGTVFEMLKFRSMTVNDDSDRTWSVERDARVTPVGRFLRASHLDELPQLVNVLRGDMSLVGPRPERPYFVEKFGDKVNGYQDRHRVKSGITGWAQVNGLVGDSSIEQRARHDNWYIEHWSLWIDIVIVARTVPTTIRKPR